MLVRPRTYYCARKAHKGAQYGIFAGLSYERYLGIDRQTICARSMEMQKLAYEHVKQTLDTLVKLGLKPNMVQVGNEINSAMSGVSISNPERFAALVNAGVKAVREIDSNIKIVMQHGRPRPDGKFMDWYNTLKKYVDFDVIGGSTYGTTNNGDDWREMFGNVVADGHEVVSLEYTGQRTKLINSVMFDMPNEMGLGTFVWEPTRYSDYPMFDRDGQKYTANARLKELAAIAKQYKATLPNWVTAAIGGKIERSTESDSVYEGSKVKLTAKPLDGWEFSGWVGDNAPNTAEFEIANSITIKSLTADGAPGNVALIDANGKVIFKRELSRGNSAETFILPATVKGRANFVIVNVGKSRKTLLW